MLTTDVVTGAQNKCGVQTGECRLGAGPRGRHRLGVSVLCEKNQRPLGVSLGSWEAQSCASRASFRGCRDG